MIYPKDIVNNAYGFKEAVMTATIPQTSVAEPKEVGEVFKTSQVEVFIRTRPILPHENGNSAIKSVYAFPEDSQISGAMTVFEPKRDLRSGSAAVVPRAFPCAAAFDESVDPQLVYEMVCRKHIDIVESSSTGVCIMYGQTGSGKSYSTCQLLSLCANDLFSRLSPSQVVVMSAVEVSGKKINCLFSGNAVSVMEDRFGQLHEKGGVEVPCSDPVSFCNTAEKALARRRTESTARNHASSRTHALVKCRVRDSANPNNPEGQLIFVDLAGNEGKYDTSKHSKAQMEDARNVNSALSTLKDCLRARGSIGTGSYVHAPFRQSPLTHLLKDVFDVATARPVSLSFLATVSPLLTDYSQTLNTMRYVGALRSAKKQVKLEPDSRNPATWDRETALRRISELTRGDLNPLTLIPVETDNGLVLASLTKEEFISRSMSGGLSEVRSDKLYRLIWRMTADARTRQREAVLKFRQGGGKGASATTSVREREAQDAERYLKQLRANERG